MENVTQSDPFTPLLSRISAGETTAQDAAYLAPVLLQAARVADGDRGDGSAWTALGYLRQALRIWEAFETVLFPGK